MSHSLGSLLGSDQSFSKQIKNKSFRLLNKRSARIRRLSFAFAEIKWSQRIRYDMYRRYSCTIPPIEFFESLNTISMDINSFSAALVNNFLHLSCGIGCSDCIRSLIRGFMSMAYSQLRSLNNISTIMKRVIYM